MNFWLPFVTGLTIGGFSCAAVQGGLLTSAIAARGDEKKTFWPTAAFLISKLIAYTLLGFLLGAFGQALSLSGGVRVVMQLVAGLYMLAVAGNLLKLHPIFRHAIIQPPRFLTRRIRKEAKSAQFIAPAFLGFLTIFIPCGTTLAMETVAISTGSAVYGALTMALFTLGTMPLFAGVGVMATAGRFFEKYFTPVAAIVLIYLGLSAVNGALVVSGSPVSFNIVGNAARQIVRLVLDPAGEVAGARTGLVNVVGGVQTASIDILSNGYNPSYLEVKAGVPVKLNLNPGTGLGCTSVFVIPQLKIVKNLASPDTTRSVEFTPDKKGTLTWTCGMGMYTGIIEVRS